MATRLDENVLKVLDYEISRAESELQRPGWTRWALVGAGSAVIWTFIDLIYETPLHPLRTAPILLLAHFFTQMLQDGNGILAIMFGLADSRPKAAFFSTKILSYSFRRLGLESIILTILLGLIAGLHSVFTDPFAEKIVFYTLAYQLISTCAIMAMMHIDVPFGRLEKRASIVLLLLLVAQLAANGYSLMSLWNLAAAYAPRKVDAQAGLCLIAFAAISRYFIEIPFEVPFLRVLHETRRELLLRRIDEAEALRRVSIYVEGSSLSDVLKTDSSKIAEWLHQAFIALDKAEQALPEYERLRKSGQASDALPGAVQRIRIEESLKSSGQVLAAAKNMIFALENRLFAARIFFTAGRDSARELVGPLKENYELLRDRRERLAAAVSPAQ